MTRSNLPINKQISKLGSSRQLVARLNNMDTRCKLSVTDVNNLKGDQFEHVFGNVIELCQNAAKAVKDARPFKDVEEICNAFQTYLEELDINEKLLILKLHPDLAGRLAAQGNLTQESTNEQQAAGLHELTVAEKNMIDESNRRYKNKFGFPFIICARENKVQSIIAGLRTRFENTREEEIHTGIHEVKKICKLRILDIVQNAE